nr:MAG TPA: hypothetical protein [Caudoviricetes sp.]
MERLLWRRANPRNLATILCDFGNKKSVTKLTDYRIL